MKKILTITLGFTVLLMVSSCKDTFLNKEPISSFPAQGFYKSTSDAQAGVYGIYDGMQSAFRVNFALWGEGRGDAVGTNNAADAYALHQNTLTPVMTSARWSNLYTVISRANYAIKYIPEVFEDDKSSLRNQLLGQAKALRAIAYFYAVRVWGDVPLILEPYESAEQELFVKREDQEKILDLIETDLEFAAENCSESYGGARNRVLITQGGANGFLTQVRMWRKKYKEAIIAADRVLENPIYSMVSIQNWTGIFAEGLSSESVFEVGYNETQTNSMRVIYAQGSDSYYFPSTNFMNSFEPGDLRKTLIYDTTQAQPRKVWKFFGEGFNDESSDPSDNNIVLVRLADIKLLKAEAKAHLNEEDKALELLNEIRNRAGLRNLDQTAAQDLYGSVLAAIMHERSIELSFEGHRWFDLVRTGKAIDVMQPINGLNDVKNIHWPIHEDALNKNPKLVQNEFYK